MTKDISALLSEAYTIKNETEINENTATRVGGLLADIVEWLQENIETKYPNQLSDLVDVNTSGATSGNILEFNGSKWVPAEESTIVVDADFSTTSLNPIANKSVTDVFLAIDYSLSSLASDYEGFKEDTTNDINSAFTNIQSLSGNVISVSDAIVALPNSIKNDIAGSLLQTGVNISTHDITLNNENTTIESDLSSEYSIAAQSFNGQTISGQTISGQTITTIDGTTGKGLINLGLSVKDNERYGLITISEANGNEKMVISQNTIRIEDINVLSLKPYVAITLSGIKYYNGASTTLEKTWQQLLG